nr:MAG TPA: hypothetical protein [Caudoviricetes sp.]
MCSQYNLNNFAKIKRFLHIRYFSSGKPRAFNLLVV